jgi:excisionase family DNA binding protein
MLTVKELSAWLNIKQSTLYLWVSQNKIPCCRIHGLVRFEPEDIRKWLNTFESATASRLPALRRDDTRDLDHLIEAAKSEVYTPRHGETRPKVRPHQEGGAGWGYLSVTKYGG